MRKILSLKIVVIYTFFLANRTDAQLKPEDSSLLNASLTNVIRLHNAVLGENIHLYNGWQHAGYNRLSIGHPYFMLDTAQTGNILYDETYYPGVSMLYDLTQDNVVIVQYSDAKENISPEYRSALQMNLVKNKISSFSLPGHEHEFVRLNPDSSSLGMPGGFYERMYNGKLKLFVKRTKIYSEEVKGSELQRRYDPVTVYYVQKDGKYYNIRSQKSLVGLLKDRKKELSAFIHSNKKRFKRNKEQFIFETTRFYDQLTTH